MRRLLLILIPGLLLALTACGGSQANLAGKVPTPEARVLAGATGKAVDGPTVAQQSSNPVSQPDSPFDGLAIVEVSATRGDDGNVTVSGKVVNRGQGAAKTTRIAVEVVDASGKRVARQQFAFPQLPTIRPGDEVAWQGQTQLKLADGQTGTGSGRWRGGGAVARTMRHER